MLAASVVGRAIVASLPAGGRGEQPCSRVQRAAGRTAARTACKPLGSFGPAVRTPSGRTHRRRKLVAASRGRIAADRTARKSLSSQRAGPERAIRERRTGRPGGTIPQQQSVVSKQQRTNSKRQAVAGFWAQECSGPVVLLTGVLDRGEARSRLPHGEIWPAAEPVFGFSKNRKQPDLARGRADGPFAQAELCAASARALWFAVGAGDLGYAEQRLSYGRASYSLDHAQ